MRKPSLRTLYIFSYVPHTAMSVSNSMKRAVIHLYQGPFHVMGVPSVYRVFNSSSTEVFLDNIYTVEISDIFQLSIELALNWPHDIWEPRSDLREEGITIFLNFTPSARFGLNQEGVWRVQVFDQERG